MATNGPQKLPADLFHMLSVELSARLDFPTLFNYLVSSKLIANAGAVSALYRISHQAPIAGGGESLSLAEQNVIIQKWAILWRTIIASAFGDTMFPYCRYLRFLDLRDLAHLLEDDKFRGKVRKFFFRGPLATYHNMMTPPATFRRADVLDVVKIISAIGTKLTSTSTLLEALSEPTRLDIFSISLPLWAPQLRFLKSLDLWDGKALADETTQNLLHVHCPDLANLRVYRCSNEDADHALARFITGMQQDSLTHFENMSNCHIGTETCLALNAHGKNLRSLKLCLSQEGVLALALLQGCVQLETLSITSLEFMADLKSTQNDVYLEIIEWFKNCKALQEVRFFNLVSAPDLLLPILLNNEVKLQQLQINATNEGGMYAVRDHHEFHQALTQQPSLHSLLLCADSESSTLQDTQTLIEAICSLQNLRELKLTRVSDFFNDGDLEAIVQHLPNLEDLYIGGYGNSDAVLRSLEHSKKLKVLTFSGLTRFTTDGILSFIGRLGEGNHGLNLSIDNADPDCGISQEEQDVIREVLADRVDGRLEYQLLRDPNMPEFDSEDSD